MTVGKRKEKLASFLDIGLSGGLIKGEKVKKLLIEWLGEATFSDTKIPLRTIATDIITGKQEVFSAGPLVDAVQASMAIPSMFKPIEYKDKILVDGGICNPVPVDIVRQMGADIVIAVNLDNFQKNTWLKKSDTTSIAKVSGRSLDIIRHYLAHKSLAGADIIIEPAFQESDAIIWKKYFWDGQGEEVIEAGQRETKAVIKKIKKMLCT
jgi:NTE family protein